MLLEVLLDLFFFICVFLASEEHQQSTDGTFTAMPLLVLYMLLGMILCKLFFILKKMLHFLISACSNRSVYVLLKMFILFVHEGVEKGQNTCC